MRSAIIMAALLIAACDAGPQWVNKQAELANEAEPAAPPAAEFDAESDALPGTDDVNAASTAENDVEAEPGAVGNESEPPPAAPE